MTITQPTITLEMIINQGLISPDIPVYGPNSKTSTGILNDNGSISVTVLGKAKTYPYPSGAARAIEKISLNGWLYWHVNDNGTYRNLDYFRKKYIESKCSQ
jgi:hypothetical protein